MGLRGATFSVNSLHSKSISHPFSNAGQAFPTAVSASYCQQIRSYGASSSNDDDIPINFASMTDEQLADTSSIPGWEFVHSPPRSIPRGALVGTVVSDKMDKTVNVAVERYHMVPKYGKRKLYTRKFMAHDENEVAQMGDMVMIVPSHRISRHKHFMLYEIIKEKGNV
jgi:small subunit ribosomal protein S17